MEGRYGEEKGKKAASFYNRAVNPGLYVAWRLLCLPLKHTFSTAEDNHLCFSSCMRSFSNSQIKTTY